MKERLLVACLLLGCQKAEIPDPDTAKASEGLAKPAASAPPQAAACVVPWSSTPPALAAAAPKCPPTGDISVPLNLGRLTFIDAPSQPSLDVELAQTQDDQARGLMFRSSMESDHGMLFSWSGERVRTFWMHNTCIPLDMLFITKDGTIAGILEQVPVLNDEPRSIPCPAAHVLEVNAGYCRQHGVAPGQRIKLPQP